MPTAARTRFLGFVILTTSNVLLARSAAAQADHRGRIEGTVRDSVHARPLAGGQVVAAGTDARAQYRRAATTDSAGRFHIDSVPPGRYLVGLESPLLDSLEITVAPREVALTEGAGTATIDLALPPASKLRSAVCSGASLPAETGVLYGHVVDASTEAPLAGAVVTAVIIGLGLAGCLVLLRADLAARPLRRERTPARPEARTAGPQTVPAR